MLGAGVGWSFFEFNILLLDDGDATRMGSSIFDFYNFCALRIVAVCFFGFNLGTSNFELLNRFIL